VAALAKTAREREELDRRAREVIRLGIKLEDPHALTAR